MTCFVFIVEAHLMWKWALNDTINCIGWYWIVILLIDLEHNLAYHFWKHNLDVVHLYLLENWIGDIVTLVPPSHGASFGEKFNILGSVSRPFTIDTLIHNVLI